MIQKRFQTQRKSIRLKDFNYSSPGAYFVTICTQTRNTNWFGQITRDGMQLNNAGQMILKIWNEIPQFYPKIQIDTFIIMPDHVHGIVIIEPHQKPVGEDPRVLPAQAHGESGQTQAFGESGQTQGSVPTDVGVLSLSEIMQRFKSLTTNLYIRGVRESGWESLEKRLWERSFHERILRDNHELERIRKYILENPQRWLETRGLL